VDLLQQVAGKIVVVGKVGDRTLSRDDVLDLRETPESVVLDTGIDGYRRRSGRNRRHARTRTTPQVGILRELGECARSSRIPEDLIETPHLIGAELRLQWRGTARQMIQIPQPRPESGSVGEDA